MTIDRDPTTGKAIKVSEGDRWIQFNWSTGLIQSAVDNAGRTATYTYDAQNNLIDVKGIGGADSTYSYDASHRITSMVNAGGGTTTNIYDSQGRVSEQHSPAGQVLKMTYGSPDPSLGRVSNTEVIGDTTKTFTYGKGRLVSFSNTADNSQNLTQSYDKYGRLYYSKAMNDPDGAESYMTYDDRGNVTSVYHSASYLSLSTTWNQRNQPLTTTDRLGVVTSNTYDSNGNLTATSQLTANGSQARTTSYVISPTGETTQVTNPLGGISSMSYTPDGDLSAMTDPNGDKTTYSYDDLGRKVTSVSPGGNAAGATNASKFTQTFGYDANNNITTVSGALGTTAYSYDASGNPVSITDPHGKSSSTTYDADGHATVITHADGSRDTFTYDAATGQRASWTDSQGRVTTYLKRGNNTTTTSPDGTASTVMDIYGDFSGGSHDVYLTDPFNNQTLINHREFGYKKVTETTHIGSTQTATTYASDTGLKTSEQTTSGTTNYTYDGFGNIISSTSTVAGRNVSYTYDAAGNIVAITYPDGTSISRTLDKTGRVITLTDWSGVVYTFTYTADGKLGGVSASNGLSYQQSFDGSLPTDKTWKDGAGTVLATFQSAYDAQGQLSSTANTVGDTTENNPLQWTAKDQVAKIGTSPVTWQGTRVTATDKLQSLNYSATTGRLTDTTDATGAASTFTYDAIGRRTSSVSAGQTTNYSWNVLGQLTAAGTDTYSYDNSGLRSSVNGSQQVYGRDLKILSDGTNKFLWGTDGSLLAQAPLGSGSGSSPSQAITNGMGSVYEMIQAQPVPNAPGTYQFAVQSQYSYSLFGERKLVAGTDITSIGFVSEQLDATTGFIYLRARYYDPKTAQFISSDPLLVKTLDEYGYAGGNPLQMIDPLGLWSLGDTSTALGWLAVGVTIAAIVATGPLGAGIMVAATVISAIGTVAGGIQTAEDCSSEGFSTNCKFGIAATVISAIPLLGTWSKPMIRLSETAVSKLAWNQGVVTDQALNASRFNARLGIVTINSAGPFVDGLNRLRMLGERPKKC